MLKIEGKFNTAISYANTIEEEAIEQIRRMCDYDFTEGSKIRIMPDVHFGKGCTIGTTMTISDKVVPNLVGVDIGCGMYTVNIGNINLNLKDLDEVVHQIPSGHDYWPEPLEKFRFADLKCYRDLTDKRRLKRSLGTLGGGNHFIEVDKSEDDNLYLVIHSGSRNLGKQVAEYYQKLAVDLNKGKDEYFKQKDEIIATYKAQGRRKEIQNALKDLKWNQMQKELTVPEDLCYLFGEYLENYLYDVKFCQQYAKRNRELMAEYILNKMNLNPLDSFHTIHNYIDTDEMILRKGAIAAHKDEKVLIPINMRDGSILAYGKGNEDWNYSAPHGAGRLMSRNKAKSTISIEEYKESMKHVYSTSINESTLDEAPMAYKSLDEIIDAIADSVDIIDILKPIYNFKA